MSSRLSIEVVEAADILALSREEQAAAMVNGTKSMHAVMHGAVFPILRAQIDKSDFEQAMVGTYYRITLLLRGVAALDDPAHFQIANSVARTVFELVLDLRALDTDRSLAAKFFAFVRVLKFRKAQRLVSFLDDNPTVDRSAHQYPISFASDPRREQDVEQECIQHWGVNKRGQPNWPDHWSGKTVAERARDAGLEFEEMYRSQYFWQCQYVHAGAAGVQDLSRDDLICSFAIAHRLIQQLAATATELVGDAFQLFVADAEFRERLHRASAASGLYAFEAALRQQLAKAETEAKRSNEAGI